jgi:hypothetical protein
MALHIRGRLPAAAFAVLLTALGARAPAEPPSGYGGYGGGRWQNDYGITSGRCDRARIGRPAGSPAASAPTYRDPMVARHEENLKNGTVGILGSPGNATLVLGRGGPRLAISLDDGDRACIGHALELAAVGRDVRWNNPTTGYGYLLSISGDGAKPGAAGSRAGGTRCRTMVLTTLPAGGAVGSAMGGVAGRKPQVTTVCQTNPGVWSVK